MKRTISLLLVGLFCLEAGAQNQEPATLTLEATTLMHEMRATPSPAPESVVRERSVSFQWPLPERLNPRGSGLDGLQEHEPTPDKSDIGYRLRYGRRPDLSDSEEISCRWPFHNPGSQLAQGKWYWQYGYVSPTGVEWSPVLTFQVEEDPACYAPPALERLLAGLSPNHPRVMLDGEQWDEIIRRSEGTPERALYLRRAEQILQQPMQSVDDIATERSAGLQNEMQRKAMLTRESRRIVDAEEANCDILLRAYLLTRDKRFADEALRRIRTIASWSGHRNIHGDFNDATMLSLCSQAYDALYDRLDLAVRQELLEHIRTMGTKMYDRFQNHLECHIADNHVWQMTLRILTMAAFTVRGELEEADTWTEYCYGVWVARLPGLNQDGAWHNGDSYFHVNIRTLIEVPYLFSRLSGFDFFADPWYRGNIRYVIYQQPPFSKSGGNGSSHQKILKPNGPRVSYADALARLTGDPWAAAYVKAIEAQEPKIRMQGATGKAGGLAWWRLQCDRPLPESNVTLADLPMGHVFPESGLASFSTALNDTRHSAMLSFRSSPYGSTSHAISNQNAFNTFYGGQSLFYSSGHHIAFVDRHALFCHRASRAHNTILPDGKNQRIGTEGYGWFPRHYTGEEIAYVVGDASNAYGEVISPLWQERAKAAGLAYTPETGWDSCSVNRFRRHVVTLGESGYTLIYDELEAADSTEWHYLLHAVREAITFHPIAKGALHVRTTNDYGASEAFLYGNGSLRADTTRRFFVPADNWLKLDAQGNREALADHWHFTARSPRSPRYRFLTILHTHEGKAPTTAPKRTAKGWEIAGWHIEAELDPAQPAALRVKGTKRSNRTTELHYTADGPTSIRERGETHRLNDVLPRLEI